MAVVGATQLEPVNILGSYGQGAELGRANQLRLRQQAAEERALLQAQQVQNALAAGDRNALMRLGEPGLAAVKTLNDIQKQDREMQLEGLKTAAQFVTSALEDPTTYPSAYQQALKFMPAEQLAAMGITEQYDPKALKSVANSLLSASERLDAELRGRAVKVQERQIGLAEKKQRFEESQASQPSADDLVVARTETAADGTVRMYNKFGKLLKTEKGAGKPSAQFERSKAVKAETQKNLNEVISSLEDISKKDGLIDQSTGSGIGRGVDVVAGFFGQSTPGAEAIARLKPIADQVLKLVPRFEGPQSDKDTQSYREAAGQLGDPTLPSAVRKAAAKEIIDIYKRRRNQFTISGEELTVAPSEGWGNLEVVE